MTASSRSRCHSLPCGPRNATRSHQWPCECEHPQEFKAYFEEISCTIESDAMFVGTVQHTPVALGLRVLVAIVLGRGLRSEC
jgi:hypothetical protein